jgi:hypothetical protein
MEILGTETQAAMTQRSIEDLTKVRKRRHRLKKKFISLLVSKGMGEYIRFYDSSWDMWAYYTNSELKIIDKMFEGGSILPVMRNSREQELVKLQIKEIQNAIKYIQFYY